MIDPEKRKTIFQLHLEGVEIKKICRLLNVSRNTVRAIIEDKGELKTKDRCDKICIDPDLLNQLYNECSGWKERIHEELTDRGIKIGYSTLTRQIREVGLGVPVKERCDQVADVPGEEMQHDTSPYLIKLSDKQTSLIASLIYFRYSKVRYLKFYRSFNRFVMKSFFWESLMHYGYSAKKCIIDNTNLAVLRGSGKNAVMAPEMAYYAKQFGFEFIAHEIRHSNRKAGNERSFWTVETNFFPGRSFQTLEDLNRQAFEWATVKFANRPVTKAKIVPITAFESEKPYLTKIPSYTPRPYLVHNRTTDQYGYAAFKSNFFWIPGISRDGVKIIEYSDRIKIFNNRKELVQYQLPADGVKNKRIAPEGMSKIARQPNNLKKNSEREKKVLQNTSTIVNDYLSFAVKSGLSFPNKFIRELYALRNRLASSLFVQTIERAYKYGITDIKTIENIAILLMKDGNYDPPTPSINEKYRSRDTYQEGYITEDPDFNEYECLLKEENDEG